MAPPPVTDDYYMILEVEQTAAPELIIRSYERLALKLHPDRNLKHNSTEAFQKLGRAYETLKDEGKRQAYDLLYPSILRTRPSSQTAHSPRPPSASTPRSKVLSKDVQIAALEELKQKRFARWRIKTSAFDSSTFEIQRGIRRLKHEIQNLDSIAAAEATAEAQRNSWGTWLLSPIYKKREESEDEKARTDRERQEKRIEHDMKERRLQSKRVELIDLESLLRKAREEIDAEDLIDDRKIWWLQDMKRARETRGRQERMKAARNRLSNLWQLQQQEQMEKRKREAAEAAKASRKQQAQFDDATKTHRKRHAHFDPPRGGNRQDYASICHHDGWWAKVQGRRACPGCSDIWTYMLQCPGCKIEACPKCQAAERPRRPRNAARTNPRKSAKATSPSTNFAYHEW